MRYNLNIEKAKTMNNELHKRQRQQIMDLQESLIHSNQLPTCVNCEHWNNETEECIKFETKPPAYVIVIGCVEWYGTIPF